MLMEPFMLLRDVDVYFVSDAYLQHHKNVVAGTT